MIERHHGDVVPGGGHRSPMPFIFRIDVEPDAAFIERDRRLPWIGFERGVETMRSMRGRFAAATGSPARFIWMLRMDPQIGETYGAPHWVAEQYAPLLQTPHARSLFTTA